MEVDSEESEDSADSVSDGHISSIGDADDDAMDEDPDEEKDDDEESEDESEEIQTEPDFRDRIAKMTTALSPLIIARDMTMLPRGGRRRTGETCRSYLTLCLTLLLDLSVSLILCLYNIPSSLSVMNTCRPAPSLTFDALADGCCFKCGRLGSRGKRGILLSVSRVWFCLLLASHKTRWTM